MAKSAGLNKNTIRQCRKKLETQNQALQQQLKSLKTHIEELNKVWYGGKTANKFYSILESHYKKDKDYADDVKALYVLFDDLNDAIKYVDLF